VAQDLPRIDVAIEDGSIARRPVLLNLIEKAKATKGAFTSWDCCRRAGVHSHQDPYRRLGEDCESGWCPVFVHAFLDGRDTPPKSAKGFLEKFLADFTTWRVCALATLSGRYYAMDRDKRWDRVEKAYRTIVDAGGRVSMMSLPP
jgi:2,3-bisphosphoglycerate-independent phosphoglycerate mutase